MENLTQFKAKLTKIGNSKYILVPSNYIKFEGIEDEDLILITLNKLGDANEENIPQ